MSRTIVRRTRRARVGALAAVLLVGALAACNSTEVEDTLVTVGADRKVPLTVRCTADQTCTGTLAVRFAGVDSPGVGFSVPAGQQTTVSATLTLDQYASIPSTGVVVGAEALVDETAPSDRDPRSVSIGLRRPTASTTRASVSSTGAQTDAAIFEPSISDDGRYVAFRAQATTLVAGTATSGQQVYVRDRVKGTTELASVSSAEVIGDSVATDPAISGTGRYVAFQTGSQNMGLPGAATDVFVRDRTKGETVQISVAMDGDEPNGHSTEPSISRDGRFVAFASSANDLVPNDTNARIDVFLHDRTARTTQIVSVSSDEVQTTLASSAPVVSDDGRYVAFRSQDGGLVAGDTNGAYDVFVRDVVAGTTTRASVSEDGSQSPQGSGAPAMSADGRYTVFETVSALVPEDTDNQWDVYVRDRVLGSTTRVVASSTSAATEPTISADGRYVAFGSNEALVAGDTNGYADIFVHDRANASTVRVSVASDGTQTPYGRVNETAAISGDGRAVAFLSNATTLVTGDTNGVRDLFVRDLG